MFLVGLSTVSSKFMFVSFFFCHILSIFKLNEVKKANFVLHQIFFESVAQI